MTVFEKHICFTVYCKCIISHTDTHTHTHMDMDDLQFTKARFLFSYLKSCFFLAVSDRHFSSFLLKKNSETVSDNKNQQHAQVWYVCG